MSAAQVPPAPAGQPPSGWGGGLLPDERTLDELVATARKDLEFIARHVRHADGPAARDIRMIAEVTADARRRLALICKLTRLP